MITSEKTEKDSPLYRHIISHRGACLCVLAARVDGLAKIEQGPGDPIAESLSRLAADLGDLAESALAQTLDSEQGLRDAVSLAIARFLAAAPPAQANQVIECLVRLADQFSSTQPSDSLLLAHLAEFAAQHHRATGGSEALIDACADLIAPVLVTPQSQALCLLPALWRLLDTFRLGPVFMTHLESRCHSRRRPP